MWLRSLALWLLPLPALAASVTLMWTPPTQATDGTPLTGDAALTGYRLYERCGSANYGAPLALSPTLTSTERTGLPDGATCYWRLSAVNASGESQQTGEVLATFPVAPVELPGAPVSLVITWAETPACPAVVSPRFVRWTITERRGGASANSIQVDELQLLREGVPVAWAAGRVATNPGGNSPSAEGPARVVDGAVNTKWLDFNFSASSTIHTGTSVLIVDNGAPITFDAYRFRTANDAQPRDPVGWRLDVSDDGVNWTQRAAESGASVPTQRATVTQPFPLNVCN